VTDTFVHLVPTKSSIERTFQYVFEVGGKPSHLFELYGLAAQTIYSR